MTNLPSDDDKLQRAFSSFGAELASALSEAGISLPPGISATELVRSLFEEMRERAQTDEARRVSQEIKEEIEPIYKALQVELPGGTANPEFSAALLQRLKVWAAGKDGPTS